MTKLSLKMAFLACCRYTGVFHLFRQLQRDRLLILCYHGIEEYDESQWWPGVFMPREQFEGRLRLLRKHGFSVLPLDEAVQRMQSGHLPRKSIAITADDGYKNTPSTMLPLLSKYSLPATIYVTTYYAAKQTPIFRLAVQYMFWKTSLEDLTPPLPTWLTGETHGQDPIHLTGDQKRRLARNCIEHGEADCSEDERQVMLQELGTILEVDYQHIRERGGLSLMNSEDIAAVDQAGIDIQLHTHRHRFPTDRAVALQELEDNARHLAPLVSHELRHFCYPSGVWSEEHHAWLREYGILSATTCEIGFNDALSNPLALKRYLDRADISETEFLAETSGFSAFARKVRSLLRQPVSSARQEYGT